MRCLMVFGLIAVAVGVKAADDQPEPLQAPIAPPPVQSGYNLEPEVSIRRTEKELIYEYRRSGQLYLVRVQPRFGPPYHFVDVDGDGALDYRPGEPLRNNVNQWILWRW